ncbi:MAG: TIGR01777 family oxidoreductase [Desulfohalobiaceae bacterium]
MHVFLMGGTGFLGSHLAHYLHGQGHTLSLLVRSEKKKGMFPSDCEVVDGDPLQPGPWQESAAKADVMINLVGKNIFARWTEQEKEQIYTTRIEATRMAVQAVAQSDSPPALINANAVGYYDPTREEVATENAPPGENFLARISIDWQSEALKAEKHGSRVVILRIAPPLSKDGGALASMLTPFRLGLGGRLGSGKQPFPWIHLTDFLRAVEFLARKEDVSGPANICAPEIVTNAEFTRAFAKALRRPALFPVPSLALKLALGELSQMLLQAPKVKPEVLLQNGFEFRFPSMSMALQDILAR